MKDLDQAVAQLAGLSLPPTSTEFRRFFGFRKSYR